jgi:hypothetical protein
MEPSWRATTKADDIMTATKIEAIDKSDDFEKRDE